MKIPTKILLLSTTLVFITLLVSLSTAALRSCSLTVTNGYAYDVYFTLVGSGTFLMTAGSSTNFMQAEGIFSYTVKDISQKLIVESTIEISGTQQIMALNGGGSGNTLDTWFIDFLNSLSPAEAILFWIVLVGGLLITIVIIVQSMKISYYRGKSNRAQGKAARSKIEQKFSKPVGMAPKTKITLSNPFKNKTIFKPKSAIAQNYK